MATICDPCVMPRRAPGMSPLALAKAQQEAEAAEAGKKQAAGAPPSPGLLSMCVQRRPKAANESPPPSLVRPTRYTALGKPLSPAPFLADRYSDRSLTQIAEVITGSHISGPRFFGLRD